MTHSINILRGRNGRSRPLAGTLATWSAISLCLLLYACGTPHDDDHDHEHAEGGTEVILTPEQVKAIGLTTGHMEKRGLSTSLKANGRLVLPPDKNAEVSVLVGGLVRSVHVREGDHVAKGQVLATLENLEFLQLQQEYMETTAELRAVSADLKRKEELHAEQISATQVLERVQADQAKLRAQQSGLAARLRLFGINPEQLTADALSPSFAVRSPIAGNLQHIGVTTGRFAEPNRPLFTVVDNSALHIDLSIFEQDVARVKVGQRVVFGHAGEPIGHHAATIYAMNKAFETDQQAVLAHAKLDDDDDGEELFAGMYIEALIAIDSTTSWSLPDEAIVNNGDEHYIFVEYKPDAFRQVAVSIGASELGYTEIKPLQALDSTVSIVVKGAYYLLSELNKGSMDHAH